MPRGYNLLEILAKATEIKALEDAQILAKATEIKALEDAQILAKATEIKALEDASCMQSTKNPTDVWGKRQISERHDTGLVGPMGSSDVARHGEKPRHEARDLDGLEVNPDIPPSCMPPVAVLDQIMQKWPLEKVSELVTTSGVAADVPWFCMPPVAVLDQIMQNWPLEKVSELVTLSGGAAVGGSAVKGASSVPLLLKGASLVPQPLEKAHQCGECAQRFISSSALKTHERVHTQERPFACKWPGCGMRSAQQGNVKTHYQSEHLKEKHRCSSCGKDDFKSKSSMERHRDNRCGGEVPGEKKFLCELCVTRFGSKHDLDRHVRTSGKHKRKAEEAFPSGE